MKRATSVNCPFGTLANPASVERGLEGVSVYLDWNNNGQHDSAEPQIVSSADNPATPGVDEQGRYAFNGVTYSAPPVGPAILRHSPPAGYAVSFPAGDGAHQVALTNIPSVIGLNFGDVPPGAIAEPPFIVVEPADRTVVVGNIAVFAVIASHARTYQWYRNGTALGGETNALLAIASVTAGDSGGYYAIVANPLDAATSRVAILSVAIPPGVGWGVANAFVAPGESFSITAQVSGTGPFTYSWYHNGVLLADVTGQTLSIGSVSVTNGGVYTVTVRNFAGAAGSTEFTLSVMGELRFYAGFHIAGRTGAMYRVEFTDALGDTNQWLTLTNFVLPHTPYLFVDPSSPFVPRRFYRTAQP